MFWNGTDLMHKTVWHVGLGGFYFIVLITGMIIGALILYYIDQWREKQIGKNIAE